MMKGMIFMSGFQCPYCSMVMPITSDTFRKRYPAFPANDGTAFISGTASSTIELAFYQCPNCGEYTILAKGIGDKVSDVNSMLRPHSLAKQFPKYVPESIRQDYEEACAISNLSPKASATL